MTRRRDLPKDAERRTIWIGQDLWDRMAKAAEKDDRTISSWLRKAVEAALGVK